MILYKLFHIEASVVRYKYLRNQCGIILFLTIDLFLVDILNSFIYSLNLIIFHHLQNAWTSSIRSSIFIWRGGEPGVSDGESVFTKHLTSIPPTPPLLSKYIFAYLTLEEVYGKSKQRFQSWRNQFRNISVRSGREMMVILIINSGAQGVLGLL